MRTLPVTAFALLVVTGCASGPEAPRSDIQAVVESLATKHPDCVRLTVHAVPPAGGEVIAVASTSSAKLGKPSDPEDLQAMKSGQAVMLDEPGALDCTFPMLYVSGKWTAACGVTMKSEAGANREQLIARAAEIAKAVETSMTPK